MWAEKYRPKHLSDMVNQKEIVERLKSFAKARNVPHCIFAGPPGTGKTTAALCLARDLYGDNYREHIMELNASDERGIDVVRETIKTFARSRSIGEIPFKIMILDEADNMTTDAQQALRRTMEKYTESCRFIMCANYSGKIIEPIQSRCAPFRFSFLPKEEHDKYVCQIATKEGVILLPDGLEAIFEVCGGDMRRAMNTLQSAASMNKPVDAKLVYAVTGRANPMEIQKMLVAAFNGDFLEARKQMRDMLQKHGVAGSDIVRQIHAELFKTKEIPETLKIKLVDFVAEIDFRLMEGADEEVQLSALLAKIVQAGFESKH
ncbi:MAG: replication factor C small subunit [Candidatus Bathyarchaeota archaeon]|nr:replication factor C small subunit [Candidatus Bathyarchaeota archaeon]